MNEDNVLAGVNIDTIGRGKKREDILTSIVNPFNKSVIRILDILGNFDKGKNNHIIRAQKLIELSLKFPDLIIMKSYKNLTKEHHKKAIIKKDFEYFRQKDFSEHVKKDSHRDTIDFVLNYCKANWSYLHKSEKEYIWDLIWVMAICSESYKNYLNKYHT